MASSITLGETETSSASPTETVSPLSPHFRVPLTDRFNYASLDCSARVHSSHRSARSPSAILSSKKDRYMLSPCSEIPNFVVVELCDDIRIDTVQLANFEFFSGVFRDFRVSVAQTYATDGKGWIEAGTYRAKNIRGVQSFHPLVELRPFYRYIRIDFLSHYGGEFYCPISLLRVYGLTQMEEWKWEVWQGGSETSDIQDLPEEKVANETNSDSPMTVDGTTLPMTEEVLEVPTMGPIEPTPVPDRVDYLSPIFENPVDQDHDAWTPETGMPSTSNIESFSRDPTATIEVSVTSDPETVTPLVTALTTTYMSTHNHTIHEAAAETNSPFAPENASSIPLPDASQPMNPTSTSSIQTLIPLISPSSVPSGESIYRTIMNRLAMLETNTTLYQKYVEEQTLQVREALRRLEEEVGRLEGISKAQQHTFSKTMHELEHRRLQMEKERWELSSKVSHLADEVALEKRLGIAQLCLLLTVLVFMALTRGSRTDAVSFLDGTMHKLHNFGRQSTWSSVDWTHMRGRSPTLTPGYTSDINKRNKTDGRSVAGSSSPGTDTPLSATLPTTPAAARSQTPRAHMRRPTTPRHDTHRFGSSDRPVTRVRRSNSHTTSANTLLSAKRFARSSHLHEVHPWNRRHVRVNGSDEENQSDNGMDGSPRPRSKRPAPNSRTQTFPNLDVSPHTIPAYEGSEAESWADTEPGSEMGTDYNEADGGAVHQEAEDMTPEHSALQSPILRAHSSSLRRHLGSHNPPSPASVTG
ncbi:UNC-like C-terminal-domain-containing protein [Gautieria morchelliformis]|nr:UNC-like C-terminal-domain-containing protein [Gautieria morchelliformis]